MLAGVALRNETKCPWDHHWSNPPFGSSRLMLTQSLDSWSNKRFGESFPKFPQFVRSWGIIIITIHWSIATFIFQLQQISSAAYFDGTPGAVRRPLTAFWRLFVSTHNGDWRLAPLADADKKVVRCVAAMLGPGRRMSFGQSYLNVFFRFKRKGW